MFMFRVKLHLNDNFIVSDMFAVRTCIYYKYVIVESFVMHFYFCISDCYICIVFLFAYIIA